MLKIVGGLLVVTACSMLGFTLSNKYSGRPKLLRKLRTLIQMLETEVMYSSNPIPNAMETVASKAETPFSEFFISVAQNLNSGCYYRLSEAWQAAAEIAFKESSLNHIDIKLIKDFGNVLGISDREDQIKHFRVFYAQLEHHETIAEEDRKSNEKMYKSLGVLIGLVILIILI